MGRSYHDLGEQYRWWRFHCFSHNECDTKYRGQCVPNGTIVFGCQLIASIFASFQITWVCVCSTSGRDPPSFSPNTEYMFEHPKPIHHKGAQREGFVFQFRSHFSFIIPCTLSKCHHPFEFIPIPLQPFSFPDCTVPPNSSAVLINLKLRFRCACQPFSPIIPPSSSKLQTTTMTSNQCSISSVPYPVCSEGQSMTSTPGSAHPRKSIWWWQAHRLLV